MRLRAIIACSIFCACGGNENHAESPDGEMQVTPMRPRGSGGPRIHAEVGALDEDKVNEAFSAARPAIDECFGRANRGMRYKVVGGDVEVMVRVKNDGSVRWAYPRRSTLGHSDTERCIMQVLERQSWPRPQGGEEGIASTNYGMDSPGRSAVDWSPGDLGEAGGELASKLRGCMAGSHGLEITLYIDPDGDVLSAGAAVDDESALDAIECAIDAARAIRFPSPGSYPAKVTVRVD
jgi:hypothetical protein